MKSSSNKGVLFIILGLVAILLLLITVFIILMFPKEDSLKEIQSLNTTRFLTEPALPEETNEYTRYYPIETEELDVDIVENDGKLYKVGANIRGCDNDNTQYCYYGYFEDLQTGVKGEAPLSETVFSDIYMEDGNYVLVGSARRTKTDDNKLLQGDFKVINMDEEEKDIVKYESDYKGEWRVNVKVYFDKDGNFIKEYDWPDTMYKINNDTAFSIRSQYEYQLDGSYKGYSHDRVKVELLLLDKNYNIVKKINIKNFENISLGWPFIKQEDLYYCGQTCPRAKMYFVDGNNITFYYIEDKEYKYVTFDEKMNVLDSKTEENPPLVSLEEYSELDLEQTYNKSYVTTSIVYEIEGRYIEAANIERLGYQIYKIKEDNNMYVYDPEYEEVEYSFPIYDYEYITSNSYLDLYILENDNNYRLVNKYTDIKIPKEEVNETTFKVDEKNYKNLEYVSEEYKVVVEYNSDSDYISEITINDIIEVEDDSYEIDIYQDDDNFYYFTDNEVYKVKRNNYECVDVYEDGLLLENKNNYRVVTKKEDLEFSKEDEEIIQMYETEDMENSYKVSKYNNMGDTLYVTKNLESDYISEIYLNDISLKKLYMDSDERFTDIQINKKNTKRNEKYEYYEILITEIDGNELILKIPSYKVEKKDVKVYGYNRYIYVFDEYQTEVRTITEIYMFDLEGNFEEYTSFVGEGELQSFFDEHGIVYSIGSGFEHEHYQYYWGA